MKRISRLLLSLIVVMAMVVIAACGSSDTGSSSSPSETSDSGETDTPATEATTDFPEKHIQIYVGFPAGGATDVLVRTMVELSQQYVPNNADLVVVNQPGAGGVVGASEVMISAPDGYIIGVTPTGPITLSPHFGTTTYESIDELTPIINLVTNSLTLAVAPDSPFETFDDFIEHVKANPGGVEVGTAGVRSAAHIFLESMGLELDSQINHVPFEGDAPARTAVMGGHIDAVLLSESSITPYVLDGELRALAYLGHERHPALPDVPTSMEYDFIPSTNHFFVFGPKDLPDDVRDVIHDFLKKGLEDPAAAEHFERMELTPDYMDPDTLKEVLEAQFNDYKEIIEATGLNEE